MPSHKWSQEPGDVIAAFEKKYCKPDGTALLAWAFMCCDTLYYLDHLDSAPTLYSANSFTFHQDFVDIAHARWATVTAITALDVAFAGLARTLGRYHGNLELDLRDYQNPNRVSRPILQHLPVVVRNWLHNLTADTNYKLILGLRNALVHRRIPRRLFINVGGTHPGKRLELMIGSTSLPTDRVVAIARELATKHLGDLLVILPTL
jgi:hypothetical protein